MPDIIVFSYFFFSWQQTSKELNILPFFHIISTMYQKEYSIFK